MAASRPSERGAFCLQILCSLSATHCVPHSSFTKRVMLTKAFLMNTVSEGRRLFSCTQAWNPYHSNLRSREGTGKNPPGSEKIRRLRKKMSIGNNISLYCFDLMP